MQTELKACLAIAAPAWFEREDFLDWRQGKLPDQRGGPACWNAQDRNGEFADVCMTFDRMDGDRTWEGSDADALPNDILAAIGQLLEEHGLQHGIIWIKPV